MKKIYLEPEIEIVDIRLISDVLIASDVVESVVPTDFVGDFEDPFA